MACCISTWPSTVTRSRLVAPSIRLHGFGWSNGVSPPTTSCSMLPTATTAAFSFRPTATPRTGASSPSILRRLIPSRGSRWWRRPSMRSSGRRLSRVSCCSTTSSRPPLDSPATRPTAPSSVLFPSRGSARSPGSRVALPNRPSSSAISRSSSPPPSCEQRMVSPRCGRGASRRSIRPIWSWNACMLCRPTAPRSACSSSVALILRSRDRSSCTATAVSRSTSPRPTARPDLRFSRRAASSSSPTFGAAPSTVSRGTSRVRSATSSRCSTI